MSPEVWALLAATGMLAGVVNVVVGSGSLITFPLLIAAGVPPVAANASNTVGLLAGSASGIVGYRRDLAAAPPKDLRLGWLALGGGIIGALLLLVLPPEVFSILVPPLIIVSTLTVAFGSKLGRQIRPSNELRGRVSLGSGVLCTGVYGGYFGAAQGVLLLALLSWGLGRPLPQVNPLKNVLAAAANLSAAAVFVLTGRVEWDIVLTLAVGSAIGGGIGAALGRRIPDALYRVAVVIIGVVGLLVYLTK